MRKAVVGLLLSVITMLVLGMVMLLSTGAFARDAHGDPVYFVKRQALWLGVGLVGCCVAACIDYRLWQRYWKPLFAVAAVLLAACYFFPAINGSHRWIKIAGFSLQPSELGKLAAITFLAAWFAERKGREGEFFTGFVTPLAVVGILLGLIAFEEDLGTTALIGGAAILTMFVAGSNMIYLTVSGVIGITGILVAAFNMQERLGRLMAFMDLEAHAETSGHQQLQGLIAFGSGGVSGLGLGNGRQKMEFLPFAHTDFIYPMIGEELGLVWTLGVVFAYLIIVVCGVAIAMNARDTFGALLGFGIVVIIALQAAINIGVTTALLPNKGIALPFISYGGSNLLFSMICIGILVNIYRMGISEDAVHVSIKRAARITPRL